MRKLVIFFLLILLGFLGVILPFIPGWPFFVVALYVIGVIRKKTLVKLLRKVGRKRGTFSRKLVALVLIRWIYNTKIYTQ